MQNVLADFTRKDCDSLVVKGLTQWDYGRILEVRFTDMPESFEAHFWYKGLDNALVLDATSENDIATIPIPNIVTTQDKDVVCWLYYEDDTYGSTEKTITLLVEPRTKPYDYIYTETEVFNYRIFKKELESKLNNLGYIKSINWETPDENGNLDLQIPKNPVNPDYSQNEENAGDYIKNRPFYDTRTQKEFVYEWDGNINGKDTITLYNAVYAKVSEEVFPVSIYSSDYIDKEILINFVETGELQVCASGFVLEPVPGKLYFFETEFTAAIVATDDVEYDGVTYSKGVYLVSDKWGLYTSKFRVVVEVGELKKIDNKYIPINTPQSLTLKRKDSGEYELYIDDERIGCTVTTVFDTDIIDIVNLSDNYQRVKSIAENGLIHVYTNSSMQTLYPLSFYRSTNYDGSFEVTVYMDGSIVRIHFYEGFPD